jgi:hypothetical protein
MGTRRSIRGHDAYAAKEAESSCCCCFHGCPSHSSGTAPHSSPRDIERPQVGGYIDHREAFLDAAARARWHHAHDDHKTNTDAPSPHCSTLSLDPPHSNHKLLPFLTPKENPTQPTSHPDLLAPLPLPNPTSHFPPKDQQPKSSSKKLDQLSCREVKHYQQSSLFVFRHGFHY